MIKRFARSALVILAILVAMAAFVFPALASGGTSAQAYRSAESVSASAAVLANGGGIELKTPRDTFSGSYYLYFYNYPNLCLHSEGAGNQMIVSTSGCALVHFWADGTWNGETSWRWEIDSTDDCVYEGGTAGVYVGRSACTGTGPERWAPIYSVNSGIEWVNVGYANSLMTLKAQDGRNVYGGTTDGTIYHWKACTVKVCVT